MNRTTIPLKLVKNLAQTNFPSLRLLFSDSLLVNLLAILIAFFKRDSLRRWFVRNRFPNVGELSLDSSLDGLIFTISHCEVPLWMIRNNQPKAIGLIASSASLANAKIIKDEAEKSGVQVLPICEVFNADNPVETMNNTQQLISTMRSNNLLQLGVDITVSRPV